MINNNKDPFHWGNVPRGRDEKRCLLEEGPFRLETVDDALLTDTNLVGDDVNNNNNNNNNNSNNNNGSADLVYWIYYSEKASSRRKQIEKTNRQQQQ